LTVIGGKGIVTSVASPSGVDPEFVFKRLHKPWRTSGGGLEPPLRKSFFVHFVSVESPAHAIGAGP
jgi:hypothetical protein